MPPKRERERKKSPDIYFVNSRPSGALATNRESVYWLRNALLDGQWGYRYSSFVHIEERYLYNIMCAARDAGFVIAGCDKRDSDHILEWYVRNVLKRPRAIGWVRRADRLRNECRICNKRIFEYPHAGFRRIADTIAVHRERHLEKLLTATCPERKPVLFNGVFHTPAEATLYRPPGNRAVFTKCRQWVLGEPVYGESVNCFHCL